VPFQHAVAPQPVDRPVPRHRHDPRPGVVGNAVRRPAAQRGQVRILDRVLGEPDVAEDAGKQGDGAAELGPEHPVDCRRLRGHAVAGITITGRTSIEP
jgi:hypothetical protein